VYQDTHEDLNRKYGATWFLYDDKLVYADEFGSYMDDDNIRRITTTLKYSDKVKGVVTIFDTAKIKTIEIAPGLYNFSDETLAHCYGEPKFWLNNWNLLQIPKRSPSRGFSNYRYSIYNYMVDLLNKFGVSFSYSRYTFSMIKDLMEPKYPELHEIPTLLTRYKSVAFSPNYGMSLMPTDEKGILLLNQFGFIGKYLYPHVFEVHHQPSYQELQDFVRRAGLDVQVRLR
jgi:hypothetical protein